jgi:hypothetical protein
MVGGIDISIPIQDGEFSSVVAVRAIRQKWPRAVFENGLTGVRYSSFREIPFGNVQEIFVYRDCEAADAWEAEGAVPDVSNTMVHIIADDAMLTVVVDEKDAVMDEIVAAIKSGLNADILHIPATLEAP